MQWDQSLTSQVGTEHVSELLLDLLGSLSKAPPIRSPVQFPAHPPA
jgi:hypothetical protein